MSKTALDPGRLTNALLLARAPYGRCWTKSGPDEPVRREVHHLRSLVLRCVTITGTSTLETTVRDLRKRTALRTGDRVVLVPDARQRPLPGQEPAFGCGARDQVLSTLPRTAAMSLSNLSSADFRSSAGAIAWRTSIRTTVEIGRPRCSA